MQRRRLERARGRFALALATLLHAAAFGALWRVADTAGPRAAPPDAVTNALEFEVTYDAPAPRDVEPSDSSPSNALAGRAPARRQQAGVSETAGAASAEATLETEAAPETDQGDEVTDGDAPDRVVDLGLGQDAWRSWVRTTKPDATATPAQKRRRAARSAFRAPPVSTTGGLQEGLEARDRELGLGPSGPVVGALYRAAHSDVAPQLGFARFKVTVLNSGTVEVTLAEHTNQTAGWTKVATRAAEALRKLPPRIPNPRSGMSLVVEIRAEEVFPNGIRREQLTGPHFEATPPRLQSGKAAQAEVEKNNPTAGKDGRPTTGEPVIVDLPGVYLAQTGKVCSYRLGLTPLGPVLTGGCDPANAGAKPQRMVRTQVTEQQLF